MENIKKRPALSPSSKRLVISVSAITVIGTLIYFEQIAILFVLSTLALVALLLAVAFADLENVGVIDEEKSQQDK